MGEARRRRQARLRGARVAPVGPPPRTLSVLVPADVYADLESLALDHPGAAWGHVVEVVLRNGIQKIRTAAAERDRAGRLVWTPAEVAAAHGR